MVAMNSAVLVISKKETNKFLNHHILFFVDQKDREKMFWLNSSNGYNDILKNSCEENVYSTFFMLKFVSTRQFWKFPDKVLDTFSKRCCLRKSYYRFFLFFSIDYGTPLFKNYFSTLLIGALTFFELFLYGEIWCVDREPVWRREHYTSRFLLLHAYHFVEIDGNSRDTRSNYVQ
jgi:hypothetical protein